MSNVEHSSPSFPTSPILTNRLTLQTFSVHNVHGKKEASGKTPASPRSLEWDVWPNGKPNSKNRLWAQPLQLLQLHGHGAHADPPPRQPTRFPVPRQHYRDLHHRSRGFAALRSIQQQQASKQLQAEFPQCSDLQASGNRWQVMCQVVQASRKLGRFRTKNLSQRTIFSSQSKGKRDRDMNIVHSLKRQSKSPKHLPERKVDSAVRGAIMAQRKVHGAEAEVEARNWEMRNSDCCFFKRSITNLDLNDFSYTKQVDGQIRLRETRLACMENWNWEIGSSTKILQVIATKLKNWEEFVAKKQVEQDKRDLLKLSLQQERNLDDRESNDGSDSGITEQSEFLVRCKRIFTILNQEAALERSHVPGKTSTILGPRTFPRCNSGLPGDTLNGTGIAGNVFSNDHLLKKDCLLRSSAIQRIWHLPLRELRPDTIETDKDKRASGMKRVNRSIRRFNHFTSKAEVEPVESYWWNLFSQWYDGSSENSYYGTDSWNISWLYGVSKLESQLQKWSLSTSSSRSSDHYALDQRSWDCKINWRTYDIDDRLQGKMIFLTSICLMRWLRQPRRMLLNTQTHFRKRVSVEEQWAQKHNRFLPRKTDCVRDLRVFPCNRCSWSSPRTLNSVRYKFTEWRCSRFRR